MKRSAVVIQAACFLLFAIVPGTVQAQFRASLRGTLTDPQGAVVPGATVTLTNKDTNATLTSTSDDNGIYQFNALPAAPYRLSVERTGFQKKLLDDVRIIPEQLNSLNVQLELGSVSQTITVTNTTPALDTETATVGGTIGNNEIQHMPTFGRDVLKVTQLAPGQFSDGSQASGNDNYNLPGTQSGAGQSGGNDGIFKTENGVQIISNGNQTENNSISIDGITTTSAVWGGSTIITPSQDSVQDVKVLTNSYDAEYGRFSGAQVQITSKGGTNNFHGAAFFYARRPGLNAFQRYNGDGNAPLRDDNFFDQLGGNFGGPIWKNKIFAFFNYETVRSPQQSATTANGWYETSNLAAMAPAGSIASTYLSFPGSAVNSLGINSATCASAGLSEGVNCATIPGAGLDVGSPLTGGLGTQDLTWVSNSNPGIGGGLDGVADIANFITSSKTNFSFAQYNGRLDANLTNNDRVAFAIYHVPVSRTNLNGAARDYNLFHHDQINQAYSVIWNRTFSPTLLNELRVNAAGWRWNEVSSNPQSPVGLPTDFIEQTGSITLNNFGPSVGSILNQWTYSVKDVATKVVGRHNFKFGGEATRLFYLNECAGCGVPSYRFFNIWDFLNDAPHSEGGGFNPSTGFPTTLRQDDRENILGFFVQDDFKLHRNLTLNLGLRWSYFGPLYAEQGNMFAAFPGSGANYLTDLTVRKADSWDAQKDNFGPQVGFAWSPGRFSDRFVIRGGYGLSYNQNQIAIAANVSGNPGLVVFPTLSMSTPSAPNPGIVYATSSNPTNLNGYPANPNTLVSFGPNGLPTTGTVNVTPFPRDYPTMRVHHYSLDTQYEIAHDLVMKLGYQGSKGRNLYFHENVNAVPAALGFQLNPQIGGGDLWAPIGHSSYNALLAQLTHRFSKQFTADAQFTWAKSLDTSSGPYFEQDYPFDVNLNYGRSDFDVGKAFKIYALWQPVLFHGSHSWMEKVIGGWSFSGIFTMHSGFPWTPVISVQGGSLYCGTCGYGQILPSALLGGAGTSTSNDAFKTVANSNFPQGGSAYFATPTYTAFTGTDFGSALPQPPGMRRNFLNLPGYRHVDVSLAKAFGLPKTAVLGESANLEFRLDAYNVFNNLNFNPNQISNNIGNANFGTITGALSGRVVTMGARFNF